MKSKRARYFAIPRTLALSAALATTAHAQTKGEVPAQAPSQHKQHMFLVRVENIDQPLQTSKGPVPVTLSPGARAVPTGVNPMYTPFEPLQGMRGEGLKKLAEDGKRFQPLVKALKDQPGVEAVGVFNTAESKMEKGGLMPGMLHEFTIPADPGDQLTLATMFAESNDLFYAPYGTGVPLFAADGKQIDGDVTSMLVLWDAGTEENQEPGVGSNQPHRAKFGAGTD